MKRLMLLLVGAMLMSLWGGAVFAADDRFVVADQTVMDKITGLVWTKDANLGKRKWDGAFTLIKELNQKKYAGFADWRLPSKEELQALIVYANGLGYNDSDRAPYQLFNELGFTNVQADGYWSATPGPDYTMTKGAYLADMSSSQVANVAKGTSVYVWPVRVGGKPLDVETPVELNLNSMSFESIRKDGVVDGKSQLILNSKMSSNERKSVEALLKSNDSTARKEREKSLTAKGKELYSKGTAAFIADAGYFSQVMLVDCENMTFGVRGIKILNWGKRPLMEDLQEAGSVDYMTIPRDKFGDTLKHFGCQ